MKKKILVIGANIGTHALMLQTLKEQHGDDILLYTPEEAKEQGLTMDDFSNIPTYKITAPPIFEEPKLLGNPMCGKRARNQRRKAENKGNKKRWK